MSDTGGLITNYATVMLWTTIGNSPEDIADLDLGSDGDYLVCRVLFDGVPRLPPAEDSILVKSKCDHIW